MDIQTPSVHFFVSLDTGSYLLWVPCNCIQCAQLSTIFYKDRNFSMYNPPASSTSKHLACNDEMCRLGWQCKNPNDSCPYIVNYASENTSTSGFLIVDTIKFLSSNNKSRSNIETPIIFGCGRKQTGILLNGVPNGLMGLGLGSDSVPSSLAKAGLVPDSFSLCFRTGYSGTIFFGDKGPHMQHSTPFLLVKDKYVTYIVGGECYCIANNCIGKSGFQAIVDSRTSYTYLPEKVFEKVSAEADECHEVPRPPMAVLLYDQFIGNTQYSIYDFGCFLWTTILWPRNLFKYSLKIRSRSHYGESTAAYP